MTQEIIPMTPRSLTRYSIISKLIEGAINGTEAAKQLSLSLRHIKRLKKAVREKGAQALIHGNKGKPSNRRTDPSIEEKALRFLKSRYHDFHPTLAAEKLKERHGIVLSVEKVRTLMILGKLWKPKLRRKNKQYRAWRARKEHYGEMEQFDGSYHRWFEDRAPECCLLAAIDDASGKITRAVFADNESVQSVFQFWKGYMETHGKPLSVYLDKYSTYKINHASAVDNSELLTQFQRAAGELDIRLITAHSPQAKGRVERLFATLQDRLVKELRLKGMQDIAPANLFLESEFVPWFNERFAVTPDTRGDVHRKLNTIEMEQIEAIFSVQSTRRVNNDFTIRFKNEWLQLKEKQPVTVCRQDTILIEERLNDSIHLRHMRRGKYLAFTILPERPKRSREKIPVLTTTTTKLPESPWKPPLNHPWRKTFFTKSREVFVEKLHHDYQTKATTV